MLFIPVKEFYRCSKGWVALSAFAVYSSFKMPVRLSFEPVLVEVFDAPAAQRLQRKLGRVACFQSHVAECRHSRQHLWQALYGSSNGAEFAYFKVILGSKILNEVLTQL
jgi:hypothetical protein